MSKRLDGRLTVVKVTCQTCRDTTYTSPHNRSQPKPCAKCGATSFRIKLERM